MAGGVQSCPPPPLEARSLLLKSSPIGSKPLLSLGSGQLPSFKEPSSVISDVPLEDGEIPPLLAVPSSDRPSPLTLKKPISYSKIVQGHKGVLPISEVISVDPATLCQDPVSLKPVSLFEGKPCVLFKSSEKEMLINNQKFVLVGKFSHGRPPLSTIKVFFAALKLQGRYNLSIFDNKHLFIELDLKIDYIMIWLKLSWKITGFEMRIFKWDCDFTPVKESAIAPVWIRIEGVPLYLFDKMSLLSIANAIGNPLSVHPLNVSRVKLNSAIICVELDVSKILMDSIYVCFEDDCSLRPVEGFWLKVFYDVLPPFCTSCFHLGHLFAVCKKGSTVSGVGFTAPVARTEQPKTAHQVFDALPSYCTACSHIGHGKEVCKLVAADQVLDILPQSEDLVVSAPKTNATAQRIEKSPSAAQKLVQDVPSCSYTALNTHQHKRGNQSQVWIASKGSGTWKSQLQISNYKDKALSIDNSFSALEVEQKSATFQELKSDLQKVLQVDNLQLSEAAFGADSSVETVVESSAMLQEIAVAAADVEHSVQQNLKTQPTNSTVQLQNTTMSKLVAAFDPPSLGLEPVLVSATKKGELHQIVQAAAGESTSASTPSSDSSVVMFQNIAVCSEQPPQLTQVSEVIPADVTSYEQIGGLTPVNRLTQVSLLTSTPPSKSWANMVEEEEQAEKKIAQLEAPTVENPSSKLVKGVDELETIKDLNTADNKANRADTKRYISKDDSQIDDIQFDYGNPLTALPPENCKLFMDSKGNQIEIHECKEAGYRHIARRSLSPPGRSSPKLISLRQKVVHACEKRSSLRDSKVYSEEFLALVEQTRSAMNSSPRDKLPTPTGPGQSRQRRNRGRNRYSYGTPDQPPRYRGKGYH